MAKSDKITPSHLEQVVEKYGNSTHGLEQRFLARCRLSGSLSVLTVALLCILALLSLPQAIQGFYLTTKAGKLERLMPIEKPAVETVDG